MFWRGESSRDLLTSTTYLGLEPGLDAAETRKVVREANKAAKKSIRKPGAICPLVGFKGAQVGRRRAFETKEVRAGVAVGEWKQRF